MDAFLAIAAKLPVAGGISSVLLAAVIWGVLTGRLVPRSALEDVRADRDARLAEIRKEADDVWAAWRVAMATNQVLASQVKELEEVGRTTHQLIQALPGPSPGTKEPDR